MNMISARVRITSPAFLGGADQRKAELRVASLRGLLRFWWRAVQPGMDLLELRKRESLLFGSTDYGQSSFLARVVDEDTRILAADTKVDSSTGYLGYGIAEYSREKKGVQTTREALNAGSEFTLRFILKRGAEQQKQELLDALWCLTNLGGMGSRSRRGFGSVVVTGGEGENFDALPASHEVLAERIGEKFRVLKTNEREDLPDFTALSRHTSVVVWPLGTNSWRQALRKVGQELNAFRSSRSEPPRFSDDRDLILDYAFRGKQPHHSPERAIFGLPHNYFFKQTRTQVNVSAESRERRASPLFIHIHELEGGRLAAVLTLIPALFLPDGEKVKVGPAGRHPSQLVASPSDFSPIRDFLSSLPDSIEVEV